jgi:hypothetical protein
VHVKQSDGTLTSSELWVLFLGDEIDEALVNPHSQIMFLKGIIYTLKKLLA